MYSRSSLVSFLPTCSLPSCKTNMSFFVSFSFVFFCCICYGLYSCLWFYKLLSFIRLILVMFYFCSVASCMTVTDYM